MLINIRIKWKDTSDNDEIENENKEMLPIKILEINKKYKKDFNFIE